MFMGFGARKDLIEERLIFPLARLYWKGQWETGVASDPLEIEKG